MMITLPDTRILVSVQFQSDTQELVYFFAFMTGLFVILARLITYVTGWVSDITEAVIFTGKVMSIAVKSVAFGLGVTL